MLYKAKNNDYKLPNGELIGGYLSMKGIINKIEIIQIDNILSINIIEKIRQVLESRGKFPKFIILYFQNIPFLDGEALRMLKEFVMTLVI